MQTQLAYPTETPLNEEMLRTWPLPLPSGHGDKEGRGRVLIIGGSCETPGTMLLAGNAALHAGAGKVAIATCASMAGLLATAIPESRVIPLPETDQGNVAASSLDKVGPLLDRSDAVLIGPGMQDESAVCELVLALLARLRHGKVILDSQAMSVVRGTFEPGDTVADADGEKSRHWIADQAIPFLGRFNAQVLLTPHAGEMAHLTGIEKQAVQANPRACAHYAAQRWGATVALKGATTFIATPDGQLWRHEASNAGLAVSGSGDTLSGIIAGLAARGATLDQAGCWGVALHAMAGDQLAKRSGPLGFLARNLAAELPALMHRLQPQ